MMRKDAVLWDRDDSLSQPAAASSLGEGAFWRQTFSVCTEASLSEGGGTRSVSEGVAADQLPHFPANVV